ncbi:MAG TPA: hypothetical protein VIJ65_05570 [Acidobacteriaceae bacterium]
MPPVALLLRPRPLLLLLPFLSGSVALVLMTGCGMGTTAGPNPISLTMNGKVQGGQQAVVGAQIQLYAAGSTGNGSAATSILTNPVVTGDGGSFDVSGDYTCPSPTTQVYIVATGGNPGLGAGGNNPALVLMAALGNCENLNANPFIFIDEVTTVAAAWTLAPFASSYSSIGASATNTLGLTNAFLNANLIVNTTNGLTATLPGNLTTEPGKIYALADAIASCVNSDGGVGCTPLFTAATPSSGSAPQNTFDAALNIVKNPGNNVADVFAAMGPQPPFATTLTQPPHDWTLSLAVTGGGIDEPTALGVDSQGNVWAADYVGLLSAYSPQGTPLTASGFGSGLLSEDYGLAIDPSDNVWVSVEESPNRGATRGSIVQFLGVSSGGTLGTSTVFSNNDIDFPFRLAADSNGNILVADNAGFSQGIGVTVVTPGTKTYVAYSGNGQIKGPIAVVPDAAHGMWVTDGSDYTVTHLDSTGNVLAAVDCCGPANGVSIDTAGDAWVANASQSDVLDDNSNGSVAEVGPGGTVIQPFITNGGIMNPSDTEVDAAQNIWVTNYLIASGQTSTSFSELSGSTSSSPGSALSPSTGFGLDAGLNEPYALAIDASGNVWISSEGNNKLVVFFGMAAPTKTPKPPTPLAP